MDGARFSIANAKKEDIVRRSSLAGCANVFSFFNTYCRLYSRRIFYSKEDNEVYNKEKIIKNEETIIDMMKEYSLDSKSDYVVENKKGEHMIIRSYSHMVKVSCKACIVKVSCNARIV